jgi:hypothetical protein
MNQFYDDVQHFASLENVKKFICLEDYGFGISSSWQLSANFLVV